MTGAIKNGQSGENGNKTNKNTTWYKHKNNINNNDPLWSYVKIILGIWYY